MGRSSRSRKGSAQPTQCSSCNYDLSGNFAAFELVFWAYLNGWFWPAQRYDRSNHWIDEKWLESASKEHRKCPECGATSKVDIRCYCLALCAQRGREWHESLSFPRFDILPYVSLEAPDPYDQWVKDVSERLGQMLHGWGYIDQDQAQSLSGSLETGLGQLKGENGQRLAATRFAQAAEAEFVALLTEQVFAKLAATSADKWDLADHFIKGSLNRIERIRTFINFAIMIVPQDDTLLALRAGFLVNLRRAKEALAAKGIKLQQD